MKNFMKQKFSGSKINIRMKSRLVKTTAGLLGLGMIGFGGVVAQQNDGAAELKETKPEIPLTQTILDLSGSMWQRSGSKTRNEIFASAASNLVGGWRGAGDVGMLTFGRRSKSSCTDVEELLPPGRYGSGEVDDLLSDLNPRGRSPLAEAVQLAGQSAVGHHGPKNMILLVDGGDNCGGDICAAAEEALDTLGDVKIHVLGFQLDQTDQKQLSCLGNLTGGVFHNSASNEEFAKAHEALASQIELDINPERKSRIQAEAQVAKLSAEILKAKAERESLLARLKTIEISANKAAAEVKERSQQIDALNKTQAKLEAMLGGREKELTQAKSKIEEQLALVNNKNRLLEQAVADRNNALSAQKATAAEMKQTKSSLKALRQKQDKSVASLNQAKADKTSMEKKRVGLENEIDVLSKLAASKEEALIKMRSLFNDNSKANKELLKERAVEIGKISEALRSAETELASAKADIGNVERQVASREAKLNQANSNLSDLKKKSQELQAKLVERTRVTSEATAAAKKARELANIADRTLTGLKGEKTRLLAQAAELKNKLTASNKTTADLKAELGKSISDRDSWQAKAKVLASDRDRLTGLFAKELAKVERTLAEKVQSGQEVSQTLADVRGKLKQQVKQNNELKSALDREQGRFNEIPTVFANNLSKAKALAKAAQDKAKAYKLQIEIVGEVEKALKVSERALIEGERRYQLMLDDRNKAIANLEKERIDIAKLEKSALKKKAEAKELVLAAETKMKEIVNEVRLASSIRISDAEKASSDAVAAAALSLADLKRTRLKAEKAVAVANAERAIMQQTMTKALKEANNTAGLATGKLEALEQEFGSLSRKYAQQSERVDVLLAKNKQQSTYIGNANQLASENKSLIERLTLEKNEIAALAEGLKKDLEGQEILVSKRNDALDDISKKLIAALDSNKVAVAEISDLTTAVEGQALTLNQLRAQKEADEKNLLAANSRASELQKRLQATLASADAARKREVEISKQYSALSSQAADLQRRNKKHLERQENLSGQLVAKGEEIGALQDTIAQKQAELFATNAAYAEKEKDLIANQKKLGRTIAGLKEQSEIYLGKIDAREAEITKLANITKDLQTKIAGQEKQIANMDLGLNTKEELVAANTQQIDELKNQLKVRINELALFQSALKSSREQLNHQSALVSEYSTKLEEKDSIIVALNAKGAEAMEVDLSEQTALNELIADLREETAKDKASLQNLQVSLVGSAKAQQALEGQLNLINGELAQAKDRNKQLFEQTEGLQQALFGARNLTNDLRAQLEDEAASKATLDNEIGGMRPKLVALQEQIDLQSTEMDKVRNVAKSFELKSEALTAKIALKNEALATLQNDYNSIKVVAEQNAASGQASAKWLAQADDKIARLEKAQKVHETLIAERDQKLEAKDAAITVAATREAALAKQISGLSEELKDTGDKLNEATTLAADMVEEGAVNVARITDLNLQLSAINEKYNIAKLSEDSLKTRLFLSTDKAEEYEELSTSLTSEVEALTVSLETTQTELQASVTAEQAAKDEALRAFKAEQVALAKEDTSRKAETDLTAELARLKDEFTRTVDTLASERARSDGLAKSVDEREAIFIAAQASLTARLEESEKSRKQFTSVAEVSTKERDELRGKYIEIKALLETANRSRSNLSGQLEAVANDLRKRERTYQEQIASLNVELNEMRSRFTVETQRSLTTRQALESKLRKAENDNDDLTRLLRKAKESAKDVVDERASLGGGLGIGDIVPTPSSLVREVLSTIPELSN